MIVESLQNILDSEKAMNEYAKKTEDVLFPVIDKAIEENSDMPKIIALIYNLPVEESRYRYLDILAKYGKAISDPDYVDRQFYNNEYYELKNNMEKHLHDHLDYVLEDFNLLLNDGNIDEAIALSRHESVHDLAKLMMINSLLERNIISYE